MAAGHGIWLAMGRKRHISAIEPEAEEEPWYRRLWPFGRKKSEPAPAAAPERAADAPVVVPPGRQGEGRPPYAYDSPSKNIRTTVIGDCVKTGFWDTDRWGHGACPGTTPEPAPVAVAEPTPAPVPPVVEPEPVQVQPLQRSTYADEVSNGFGVVADARQFPAEAWTRYEQTIVKPNLDPQRPVGAYAVAARRRRKGVCPVHAQ